MNDKDYDRLSRMLKDEDSSERNSAVYELEEIEGDRSLELLTQVLLEDEDPNIRFIVPQTMTRVASPDKVIPVLQDRILVEKHESVREAIVSALGDIKNEQALQALFRIYFSEKEIYGMMNLFLANIQKYDTLELINQLERILLVDPDPRRRERAATAFVGLKNNDIIPFLARSIVNDPIIEVRVMASKVLQVHDADWQQKADAIFSALGESSETRINIDKKSILWALEDGITGDYGPYTKLLEYILSKVTSQNEGVITYLGALIVECAGGDQDLAGTWVDEYQKNNEINLNNFNFISLRYAVGGKTALDPITRTLQNNLQIYFQKPLHKLNLDTRATWEKTIQHANLGFRVRIWMSIVIFMIGVFLLITASIQFLYGNLDQAGLFGPTVSFVSGLGSLLLLIYTGPLKDIRESVNDLAIGNAAYIAFVHRVLEISHTFSYFYLKDKIDFEQMGAASDLIEDAMRDTISMLDKNFPDVDKNDGEKNE